MPIATRDANNIAPRLHVTCTFLHATGRYNSAIIKKSKRTTPPRSNRGDIAPLAYCTLVVGIPARGQHRAIRTQPHRVRPTRIRRSMNIADGHPNHVPPLLHVAFTSTIMPGSQHGTIRAHYH